MKVLTVIGARPQFVKASVVSKALRAENINEVIIHTGQHFDPNMSDVFFSDLDLPVPDYHLGIHSLGHGTMTGRMMESIESLVIQEEPSWMIVYGDTNSTLAGALVASKLNIPIAHIEAGLRSYNRAMPEEVNRLVTDSLSTLLFVPTPIAMNCLQKEGITRGVYLTGDVMMDAVFQYKEQAETSSKILEKYRLKSNGFYLATLHRPSNTDGKEQLSSILQSFTDLDALVVLPLHPRTKKRIHDFGLEEQLNHHNIQAIPPASYLDMLMLEKNCRAVITDSGGIQKEAYLFHKPCFTLRNETEWKETVASGWNQLVNYNSLLDAVFNFETPDDWPQLYGEANAASLIVNTLLDWSANHK